MPLTILSIKKQDSIGSFEQHLAKTAQHIAQAQTQLAQLSALLPEKLQTIYTYLTN